MTIVGALFAALIVFGMLKQRLYPWILALSAAFPYTAAIVVAGNAIYVFHLAALGAMILLCFSTPDSRPRKRAGSFALALFVAWSLFITLVGPLMFEGQAVLGSRTGIDEAVAAHDSLHFSVSNVAQAGYLVLAVFAVLYIVHSRVTPLIALVPMIVGTVVGAVNLAFTTAGLSWPSAFFDTSPNVIYSHRFRGGLFNEPSEFAGFTVAAVVLFSVSAAYTRGKYRAAAIALTAIAFLNLFQVRAGTALAGLAVIAAIGIATIIWRLVAHGRGALFVTYGLAALSVLLLTAGSGLADWVLDIITGKVGSSSLRSRSGSDLFSLDLSLQTWGLGVGLGGNRPSSFATMLLSCVGVIGVCGFAIFLTRTTSKALRSRVGAPLAWGLLALLAAKSVSLPDLTTPSMWMLIAACTTIAWNSGPTSKTPIDFLAHAQEIGQDHGLERISARVAAPMGRHRRHDTPRRSDRSGRDGTHDSPIRRDRSALRRHAG